jgi:hypothetical protein
MLQAEPKTVLNFLSDKFEFVLNLIELNKQDSIIHDEKLKKLCQKENVDWRKLVDYKIIRELQQGDYELRKPIEIFINFISEDFKLDLPENIRKYFNSIEEIYEKILYEENLQSMQKLIAGMIDEVQHFIETIESNTRSLLNESKTLKANVRKIDYVEKIKRATYLIDFYIVPLNKILDAKSSGSVIYKLSQVRGHANGERINHADFMIRSLYEKLYNQVISANIELVKNSKVLTKELLPLLERIRTESQILAGFMEFLKKPNSFDTPKMLKRSRHGTYDPDAYFSAKDIWDQIVKEDDIVLQSQSDRSISLPWVFDRVKFKKIITQSLPIRNYFAWSNDLMKNEITSENFDFDKFFAMTSLIFDDEYEVIFEDMNRSEIKFRDLVLDVPFLNIDRKPKGNVIEETKVKGAQATA